MERIHRILTHTSLPELPLGDAGRGVTTIDASRRRIAPVSLPYVTPAEVLGLLALLGDQPSDVFELAERFGRDFGHFVSVVKAAELLGFVQTPEHDVLLTPLGREVAAGSTADQKRIVREQLLKLKIYELLVRLIRVQESQLLPEEELMRELQTSMPHEKPRPLFRTLLSWGRYAEIISYDQRRHLIRLHEAGRTRGVPNLPPVAPPSAGPSGNSASAGDLPKS